jgi:hypothetical protein
MKDVSRSREDFRGGVRREGKSEAIQSPHTGGSNNPEIRTESSVELHAKEFLVSERVIHETLGPQNELRPGERKTSLG